MPESAKFPLFGWLACAIALVVLVLLAYAVGPVGRLDANILSHLSAYEHSSLGSIAKVIAFFADPVPVLLMLGVVCTYALRRRRPLEAAAALVIVAGANLTTQVLKAVLAHPRFEPILLHQPDSNSFPSGHVTGATSIVLAVLLVAPPRLRGWVVGLGTAYVFAVGCSLLVLEWHLPSDVLGGILVALGWGFAVLAGLRFLRARGYSPVVSRAASPSRITTK